MNYIWLNPVIEHMYGEKINTIYNLLEKLGYTKVSCESPAIEVQEKFVQEVKMGKEIVIDSRCPKAIQLVQEQGFQEDVHIAKVEPILIHSARKLYQQYEEHRGEGKLFILCPCTYLAQMGQELFLAEGKTGVVFCTWNDFLDQYPLPRADKIEESPIPLGFFEQTPLVVKGFTGEEEIIQGIKEVLTENNEVQLVELLYCKDGCNNGDGVGW